MADPLSFLLLWLAAGGTEGRTPAHAAPRPPAPRPQAPRPPAPRARPPEPRDIPLAPDVVIPAGLTDTTFPGPNWEKLSPVTQDVAQRAAELLPVLWDRGEGTGLVERLGDRLIGFLSESHGDKRGVSAWRLKQGTIITTPMGKPAGVIRHDIPRPVRAKTVEPAPKPKPKPAPAPAPSPSPRPAPATAPPPKKRRKKTPPAPTPEVRAIVPVSEPEPAPPPAQESDESEYPFALRPDKPVLMQGASGPAVEELQRLLGIGGTLGFYGPMTVAKVRAYQEANSLPVDGITGEITWGSLLA